MTLNRDIVLRKTQIPDLETLFIFQLDKEAAHLAAFTPADRGNKAFYLEKFTRLLSDPSVNMFTILLNGIIIGSIAKFEIQGKAEITYWIDKEFWAKGVATTALARLLELEKTRPLTGRTAFDNVASQKVMEKAGFVKIGSDRGFANARQCEVEEFIYRLD